MSTIVSRSLLKDDSQTVSEGSSASEYKSIESFAAVGTQNGVHNKSAAKQRRMQARKKKLQADRDRAAAQAKATCQTKPVAKPVPAVPAIPVAQKTLAKPASASVRGTTDVKEVNSQKKGCHLARVPDCSAVSTSQLGNVQAVPVTVAASTAQRATAKTKPTTRHAPDIPKRPVASRPTRSSAMTEPVEPPHDPRVLKQQLAQLKLRSVEILGDGNCQFRALSSQLFAAIKYHLELRAAAVKEISEHKDFYACFLENGENIDDYLARMAKAGEWGDQLTLQAIANRLGVAIHVISSKGQNFITLQEPDGKPVRKELYLSYVNWVHYNSLFSQDKPDPVVTREEQETLLRMAAQ
eukprot:TRINITY_DN1910_c0_g1_i4.p1 TRINITY_DN1910_c0_g1~~TRINITY_DN1910_c0_g1_i4.p1  ORF type:complete len:353 (-),score=64.77 TRINITY_DN1910_c0_g1_i4:83-1141(-)